MKGAGTSLLSPLLQSRILFKKNPVSSLVEKKKRKTKRPCFKQSQEATISLCIMIRRGKARRGRRVLIPNPLNSLLCIRQQQQYKQTSQRRADETLSSLVHSGLHHCCLLASAEVKKSGYDITFLFVSDVIHFALSYGLTVWFLALQLNVLNVQLGLFVNFIEFGDLML